MYQIRTPTSPSKSSAAKVLEPKMRVAFVLVPQFTLTAFAGFIDTLRLAADEGDRSRPIGCEWSVLGGPTKASCGTVIEGTKELKNPERFDYIVVVGGLLSGGQTTSRHVYKFLNAAAKARVNLLGLCTGSFVLARAGVLNGYTACVSWFHRDDFTTEFPNLRVMSNQMYLIDRDRMTCAGGTSVVHLAAHLVEKHCGRAQAVKSLRILIEDQPLPSDTMQPEEVFTKRARDSVVQRAMLMMEQSLSEPDSVENISQALGVGIRTLERRFIKDVGITLREYRLRIRMMRAKWLIEHTDYNLTSIGLDCGFGSPSHFSSAFARYFNMQPSRLRRSATASTHAQSSPTS